VVGAAAHDQSGDARREALARFIHTYRAQIKDGFRARFASGALAYYDSSDFFATVLRRADLLTSRLGDAATPDARRLLREIVLEALSDCARAARNERRLQQELRTPGCARSTPSDSDAVDDLSPDREELDSLRLSGDEFDLARFRAGGMQHAKVAAALGVSAATIRMRWVRLVQKARSNLRRAS
jgi:hypothetical protein